MLSSSALLRPSAEIADKGHPRRSGARGNNAFQLRVAPPLRGDRGQRPSAEKRSARKMRSSSALLRPSADGLCRSADWRLYQSGRSGQRLIRGEAERAEKMLSSSALLRPSADGLCRFPPPRMVSVAPRTRWVHQSGKSRTTTYLRGVRARGKNSPAPRCSAPPRMVSVAPPTGGCTNPGDPGNDLSAEKRSARNSAFQLPLLRPSADGLCRFPPPRMVSVAPRTRGLHEP
jgi:hypothetical protein